MKVGVEDKFDPKSFLKAVSSPLVCSFISKEKLVKSDQFRMTIDFLDRHFDLYKDTGSFERLLNLLDGSKYAELLAGYLRVRHGLRISREGGAIKVSINKGSEASVSQRKIYSFRSYLGEQKSSANVKNSVKTVAKSAGGQVKYIDALDHPTRLPGCFGHGRRN